MALSLEQRQAAEREIVRATVEACIAAGWYPSHVDTGECQEPAHNVAQVMEHVFSVDESRVTLFNAAGKRSWLNVTLGNDGYDAISDYGVSLEPVIRSTDALCDRWESLAFANA